MYLNANKAHSSCDSYAKPAIVICLDYVAIYLKEFWLDTVHYLLTGEINIILPGFLLSIYFFNDRKIILNDSEI